MTTILLVEDDPDFREAIEWWLEDEGYLVESLVNGAEADSRLREAKYDLVILDWDLPGMPGIEVLKRFRTMGGVTPILMLTGKSTVFEKEEGLDAGADDYLTKPFHMIELCARVRASLRRTGRRRSDQLTAGDIVLDLSSKTIVRETEPLALLPKEFDLLRVFMQYEEQTFSVETLHNLLWIGEIGATDDTVVDCIKALREKLSTSPKSPTIRTVHGVGYKLELS
jgi:DNA-binding response OmpR family regulator